MGPPVRTGTALAVKGIRNVHRDTLRDGKE